MLAAGHVQAQITGQQVLSCVQRRKRKIQNGLSGRQRNVRRKARKDCLLRLREVEKILLFSLKATLLRLDRVHFLLEQPSPVRVAA